MIIPVLDMICRLNSPGMNRIIFKSERTARDTFDVIFQTFAIKGSGQLSFFCKKHSYFWSPIEGAFNPHNGYQCTSDSVYTGSAKGANDLFDFFHLRQ
jgi:hypothetical protein